MNKYNKTTTNRMREEARRRQILIKRIKCACGIIGGLSFVYILGITGGVEHDLLTIAQYIGRVIPSTTILVLSVRIGLGISGDWE